MSNLKASSLRIGNIIASSGNPSNIETWVVGKVVCISSLDSEFEQLEVETEEEFTWFFKDNYFGIPLTEEWLFKFGFNKDYKSGYIGIDVNNSEFVLSEPLKMGEFQKNYAFEFQSGGWSKFNEFEFVHELQNFFFALTKNELSVVS